MFKSRCGRGKEKTQGFLKWRVLKWNGVIQSDIFNVADSTPKVPGSLKSTTMW